MIDRIHSTRARKHLVGVALVAIVAGFLAPLAASPAGAAPVPAVTYTAGDIDGQNGWAGTSGANVNDSLDQEVVVNSGGPASFRNQSWRYSNEVTSGSFGDMPFSPAVANEAGETTADNAGLSGGTRQSSFVAQWQFSSADPSAEQAGLGLTASPDRGDGARMSWVRMEDTAVGLRVLFSDYQHDLDPDCDSSDPTLDGFVETPIASGLDRGTAHTIRIEMNFVDGAANDVVRVYVDGALAHTGTSWEDYFRDCEVTATRTVDSLLFRASGTAAPANAGKGFLIDNVSILSGPSVFSTGFESDLPVAPPCRGEAVTVDLAYGEAPTNGPDVIRGTEAADTVDALAGDDIVCALGGADVIYLGPGADVADGGRKTDQLNGGSGNDRLIASFGYDVLTGNGGADVLAGGPGRDHLLGGVGNDRLIGGLQRDNCNGGNDTDTAQQCEVRTNIP